MSVPCSEPNCSYTFQNIGLLRNHLKDVHHQDHPTIHETFANKDEFESWKSTYEGENDVRFIFRTYTGKVVRTEYFFCNRSKITRPSQSKNKREKKVNGSVRMEKHCTCGFVVTHKAHVITVRLFPEHYNHILDDSHKQLLSLPNKEKGKLIKRLESGAPRAIILREIRDEYMKTKDTEDAKVIHFTSYDNLYYLNLQCATDWWRKDEDDTTSLKKWIAEYTSDIVYHKFKKSLCPKYPVRTKLYVLYIYIYMILDNSY